MTGSNLKYIRYALGLTQKQMAEELGITREHYATMEGGKAAVTKRTASQVDMMFELAQQRWANELPKAAG